jgi:hypothetical protein
MNEIRTLAYHRRFSQCDKVSAGLFGTPKWRSRTGFILTLAGRGRFSFPGATRDTVEYFRYSGAPAICPSPLQPARG